AVASREVAGHLGGEVAGGDADVELAALDLLLGGGTAGGVAGGGGLEGGPQGGAGRLGRLLGPGGPCGGAGGPAGGAVGGGAGGGGPGAGPAGVLAEGDDQVFLAHAVPAGDALLAGHVRQGLPSAGLQLIAGHAKQLRHLPGAGALKKGPREPSLES